MKLLVNIISLLIESFLAFRITDSKLVFKYNPKNHVIPFFLFLMINSIRYLAIRNITFLSSTAMRITALFLIFLVIMLFYQDKLYLKLWWYSYNYLLNIALEVVSILIVSTLLRVNQEYILQTFSTYTYCLIISKFLNILIVEYTARKFQYAVIVPKSFKFELIIILLLDFMLILFSLLFTTKPSMLQLHGSDYVTLILIIILFVSALMILLCYKLTNLANQELENQLKLQQVELENKLNDDLSAVVQNLRSLRHDMNNHIGIIKGLADTKEYDLLNQYLNDICDTVSNANDFIFVENQPLQILLNSKISKAQQKGIHIESEIEVNEIKIPDKEMCTLLGNIIDNALEAAEKASSAKFVQLIIKEKGNACFISCKNTFQTAPVIVDGKFLTTKRTSIDHGIGTENIKSIVAKYKGSINYTITEKFCLSIVIPYK
ncbi:sensor histidine kinase [[Clostridium] polysaccharolyticum]|uniref:Sensor_kinase_SpoOB-type, alpha-helical domain n=1 Tax=[Clostridium] polysaccharolyticum TaxID=29364 RepID=A0A1H9Z800_9FIRM|nr:sensor histidine kinase [[Clostridium] polysaccharolyticum]SES77638.1 Sensor_kinase_SpoOB-type, alpha-helical domain [[Clostridium] polysaccharolyticum]